MMPAVKGTLDIVATYWSSRAARERAFRWRELRAARAVVSQEPRRKGQKGRDEGEVFRSAIRAAVAPLKVWPRPRAALAVDFTFHTTSRQPPQLWHMPKHYLDLLGESGGLAVSSSPPLYCDDRQVKMLYASVHHGWALSTPQSPAILLTVRTRSDALYTMNLAYQLSQRPGAPGYTQQDAPTFGDLDASDEDLRTAQALEHDGDPLSQHTAHLLRHHARQQRQEALLHRNDEGLTGVFFSNAHRLLARRNDREHSAFRPATLAGIDRSFTPEDQITFAREMLTGLSAIELPPLPNAPGESRAFKENIDRICADYVAIRPGLFPLVAPLRVTVLVVPPERHHNNSADLDNIVIRILAAVDKHMKPPISPWYLGPLPPEGLLIAGREARMWKQEGLARAKALGSTAIWAYQVVELARTPRDPTAGQVLLVLGHGMNHESLWSHAASYVDSQFDDDWEDESLW